MSSLILGNMSADTTTLVHACLSLRTWEHVVIIACCLHYTVACSFSIWALKCPTPYKVVEILVYQPCCKCILDGEGWWKTGRLCFFPFSIAIYNVIKHRDGKYCLFFQLFSFFTACKMEMGTGKLLQENIWPDCLYFSKYLPFLLHRKRDGDWEVITVEYLAGQI